MDILKPIDNNNLILTVKTSASIDKELFDHDNITNEKCVRIDSKGMLVAKKDSLKFICYNKNSSEETPIKSQIHLCNDETSIAFIETSSKNVFYITTNYGSFQEDETQKLNSINTMNCFLYRNDLIWKIVIQEKSSDKLLSLNSLIKSKYTLVKKHDVIKFGKLKLCVSEIIHINSEGKEESSNEDNLTSILKVNHKFLKSEEFVSSENVNAPHNSCRVCYSHSSSVDNPLVSICNCTGSVKFIHYQCLETWVLARSTYKEKQNVIIVKCRLYCELCKCPLPARFTYENKVYKLIENQFLFEENTSNLVLESIDFHFNDYYQYFYIITLGQNEEIKLGRSKACEVRLKDDNTSSIHACIICCDNKFYIFDKKSKFGTSILEKQCVKIDQTVKNLQINGVCLSAFIKLQSQKLFLSNNGEEFMNSTNQSPETNYKSNSSAEKYLSEQFDFILSKMNYQSNNSTNSNQKEGKSPRIDENI